MKVSGGDSLELVKSFEEIAPLVKQYLKVGMETNLFLSEEEYRSLIAQERLYYECFEGGILLFKKRAWDTLCYFELNCFEVPSIVLETISKIKEPLVVELVYKTKEPIQSISFFQTLGFKEVLRRVRMKRKERKDFLETPWKVKLASKKQQEAVFSFLQEEFSLHTGCIPSKEELSKILLQEKILVVQDEKENIMGVLHFEVQNAFSQIRHLAVKEAYRHQNVAGALIQKYHEITMQDQQVVWVSEQNETAQRVYQKYGYDFEAYHSLVMMRKDEEDGSITKTFNGD